MKFLVSEFAPFTNTHKSFITTQTDDVTLLFVNEDMSPEAAHMYMRKITAEVEQDVQVTRITYAELEALQLTSAYYIDILLNTRLQLAHQQVISHQLIHGHEQDAFATHHIFDDISETMAKYLLENLLFGLTKQIALVFNAMSYKRFKHTMRVVYRMQQLVALYDDLEPIPAYYSALFHDFAKELPIEEQFMYVEQYFPTYTDTAPAVYHGFAAAVLLQLMDDTLDGDVYEAIAYHPIGIPNYCRIGLALMVADYCDYTRAHKEQWQQVWKTATTVGLEAAIYERILYTEAYFKESGANKLYRSTQNMLEWLKELIHK